MDMFAYIFIGGIIKIRGCLFIVYLTYSRLKWKQLDIYSIILIKKTKDL